MVHSKDVQLYIETNFKGLQYHNAWGEMSWFYNPDNKFARGSYFATIKDKDGENDKGSHLDRDGIWRLNTGIPRKEFEGLFGPPPARPAKGQTIECGLNLEELNRIMPHPIYGWMSWVCVLNPDETTFSSFKALLELGYEKAVIGFEKRSKKVK